MLLIDANNCLGVPSAYRAMGKCIEQARKTGACFAAIRGGNHFGIGAYFTNFAAQNDMIGLALSNGPKAMAPIGGKEPILGTNPVAVSIPAASYSGLTLDMATSVVAKGKDTLAKKGRPLYTRGLGH